MAAIKVAYENNMLGFDSQVEMNFHVDAEWAHTWINKKEQDMKKKVNVKMEATVAAMAKAGSRRTPVPCRCGRSCWPTSNEAVARDDDAKRAHDANLCACQQLCIATEIALAAPGRPLKCCHLCVAQRFSARTSVHCVDDVIMVHLSSGSP